MNTNKEDKLGVIGQKDKETTRQESIISQMTRFLGIPMIIIGVLTLLYTYVMNYTPNWLLAMGLAFVFIGTIVYFDQIRRRSKF